MRSDVILHEKRCLSDVTFDENEATVVFSYRLIVCLCREMAT